MATLSKPFLACVIAALLAPGVALADEASPAHPPMEVALTTPSAPAAAEDSKLPAKTTRRGGLVIGLAEGFGAMSVVGYPNDVQKIGYAPYYTATGARGGPLAQLWVGVAFSDWLTFGLGFTGSTFLDKGGHEARSDGGVFRVEAFPLFSLGGRLRDLGVMFEAGLGSASVTDAMNNKLVDGGAASIIGGGVFYEGFRVWKLAQGPFLMGDYLWSDTALRPGIFLGWRMSFYSKP
jgi:hypothetical protein